MSERSILAPRAAPAAHSAAADAIEKRDGFEALAHAFVEAFNRHDADGLIAVAHPRIVFRPSTLTGPRQTYVGHDGLRRWVATLAPAGSELAVRIREVREIGPGGFLVLSKVHFGEELIADSAMIASVQGDKIIKAHGYLSDEQMLARLGLIP